MEFPVAWERNRLRTAEAMNLVNQNSAKEQFVQREYQSGKNYKESKNGALCIRH